MARSFFLQQIIHVFEILVVSALVGRHRNGIGIFLNGGIHHLFYTAVVPQVNHFYARGLDDAAHDVYGGIVSIK